MSPRSIFGIAGLLLLFASSVPAAPGRVIRLRRIAEPRENAFTMLVPEGWQTEGGVYRVNPDQAGGAGNSVAAKVDFTVRRDAAGTAMVRTLPENLYMDMRGQPAAPMFPVGSNYNGMTVMPPMDALSFLQNVVLRHLRPRAANVRVVWRAPLAQVAQSYDAISRNMGLPNFRNDTGLLVVDYSEGGVNYREVLYTDVQVMMMGLWCNKDTYTARAPVAEFDWMRRVFQAMNDSMRLNPQWVEREVRSQLERARIITDVQNHAARIDAEIVRHRQATNAAINGQMQRTLNDQAIETDPHTGKRFLMPTNRGQIYFGRNGDAIVSEDPNWNPANDPRYAGGGYEKPKEPAR
jgi:hypothetical protein